MRKKSAIRTSPALSALLVATAFVAIPVGASAQGQGAQASVAATASVIAQLEATGELDLRFGDVIPGISLTVPPSSPDAGRFRVQGGGNAQIQISFDLPAGGVLDHESSAATLPVTFGSDAAGWGANSSSVDGTFDPSTDIDENLQAGELFVFIGGTVDPAVGQEEGDYSGQITLNVAYTGS